MMPDNWTSKPLCELVNIRKGKKVTSSDKWEQGSIPYIGAQAFGGNYTAFTSSKEAVLCEHDDVLILWDGERSGLAATGLHGAVSSTVARLRTNGNVNSCFLYYFIYSKFKWIQERRTGLAVPHVPKDLKDLLIIDLPTFNEQKKIAAILSSVDDAIQATQAVIDQTRRVKQGLMQQLLTRGIGHTRFKQTDIGEIPETWITGEVGDFLKLQRGFDITQKQVIPGEVPVISSSGISYYHNQSMIEPPGVITGRKGKLGKVYFVDIPYWPHDTSLFVKDFKGNDPRFIFWVLIGLKLEKLDAATAVPTLNRNTVHKIKIAIPPIDEQKNIVKILDSIINTIINQKREKDLLNVLKHGLMQDLLTGRVRVKPDEVNTT